MLAEVKKKNKKTKYKSAAQVYEYSLQIMILEIKNNAPVMWQLKLLFCETET